MGLEIGQILLVFRHEQELRRSADAEPGQVGKRLVGGQPAAQIRHSRRQVGYEVGEGHGEILDDRHGWVPASALVYEPVSAALVHSAATPSAASSSGSA